MVKKRISNSKFFPKAYEVPSSKIYSNGWMKETRPARGAAGAQRSHKQGRNHGGTLEHADSRRRARPV